MQRCYLKFEVKKKLAKLIFKLKVSTIVADGSQ
jgi:hypothetical protein